MKELWSILMEKLKLVNPDYATIGIGIVGIFSIGMLTKMVVSLFNMIVSIVEAFTICG